MVTTTLSLLHDSHETIISLVQPKKAQGRDQQGHLVTVWQGWDFGMKRWEKTLEFVKGKALQQGISRRNKVQGEERAEGWQTKKKTKARPLK